MKPLAEIIAKCIEMAKCYIGTSGWSYKGWKGSFYPEDIKSKEFLEYYQEHFNTVEINSSYYRLPGEKTVKNWAARSPAGFVYSVKASRYLSHVKKLKDPEEPVGRFMEIYKLFGEAAGPVLLQLPPNFVPEPGRLEKAIDEFYKHDKNLKLAVEFRNPDCYQGSLTGILNDRKASMVIHDMKESGIEEPDDRAPFIFKRYHGPGEKKYAGNYSEQQLEQDAVKLKKWLSQGKEVYVYFNNDSEGFAPWNALKLNELIGRDRD